MANTTLTAIPGIRVGHYTDLDAIRGCTVVLCPPGTVAGVDVRGSAPGTRETDLLDPINTVSAVNAVLLSGGSAYGLDAAAGVMRWCEAQGQGFDVGVGVVPIVPAAVLFDLSIGDPAVRPGADAGYSACVAASAEPVPLGCVGAGTGATVGKIFGPARAIKSGLGSAARTLESGVTVAALVAVNALGDVRDPNTGAILAGARNESDNGYADTLTVFHGTLEGTMFAPGQNTTIAVVATDAALTKSDAQKMAQIAHNGLARTICPVHTSLDGDTIFALGTGGADKNVNISVLGTVAASVLGDAVLQAVHSATSMGGIPSAAAFLT